MGARGSGASSEAADVVLLVDRLDRLAEALAIARGARRIALETIIAGMGSVLPGDGVAAALGYLPPVAGAVVQEFDRRRRYPESPCGCCGSAFPAAPAPRFPPPEVARLERGARAPRRANLPPASSGGRPRDPPPGRSGRGADKVGALVREHLLPHERADDSEVYPAIEKALGTADPIAAMHRTHGEMHHLCRLLARMIADMPAEGPSQVDANDFRRVLVRAGRNPAIAFRAGKRIVPQLGGCRSCPRGTVPRLTAWKPCWRGSACAAAEDQAYAGWANWSVV